MYVVLLAKKVAFLPLMRKLHTTTVWIRKIFTVKKVLFSFNLKKVIPHLQWLAGKLDFLSVCDIKWG